MVSPFYLGSNPAEDAAGQYPGKPISGGGKPPTPPPELINLTDDFEMMWDKVADEVTKATIGLPQMYMDEQKNLWKSLFKISGGLDSYVDVDPYTREISGDVEQFHKAADFQIDLIKVFTDPQAQLKDIWTAAFNKEDFRREARLRITDALLYGPKNMNGLDAGLMGMTIESQRSRLDASLRKERLQGNSNFSVHLTDLDPQRVQQYLQTHPNATQDEIIRASTIYHVGTGATAKSVAGLGQKKPTYSDSRADFGQQYKNFITLEDAENKNRTAYIGLVNQAGTSMMDIFADNARANGTQRPDALIHQLAAQYATPGSTQYTQIVAQLNDGYKRFQTMNDLSNGISGLYAKATSPGTNSGLRLATLDQTRVAPGVPFINLEIGGVASKYEIDKARDSLEDMGRSVQALAVQLDAFERTHSQSTSLSAAETLRIKRWTTKMKKEIMDLTGESNFSNLISPTSPVDLSQRWGDLLRPTPGGVLTARQIADRRALTSRLKKFRGNVTGYNVFSTGLQSDLAHIFVDHHIIPSGIDPLSSVSSIAGLTQFGKQIQMYTLAARDSYKLNHFSDVYKNVSKGKVSSVLFKTRFIGALPNYTPQKVAQNFLNRNHYWGLKVDKFYYEEYENWVAAGKPAGQFSIFYRGGNGFVYRIAHSKRFGFIFQNRFTIDLGIAGLSPIAAVGGTHFKSIAQFNLLRAKTDLDFSEFLNLQSNMSTTLQPFLQMGLSQKNAFFAALLSVNDPTTFMSKFGDLPFVKPEEFYMQLQEFKAWLRSEHFDVFDAAGNIDPNKMQNLEALFNWFAKRSASASYIDVTRNVVGLVEKLSQRLNVWQDKVLDYDFLGIKGFKIGKYFFWEQQVTGIVYNHIISLLNRIIAKFTSRFVAGAAGVATGGLALLLAPILEKISYFIATQVTGKLKGAVSGILHGDFTALGNAVEGSFTLVIKIIAYTTLIVALFLLVPLDIVNYFTENMSPRTPQAYNNITPGRPITSIPGGDVVPNACPLKCLLKSGGSTIHPSYEGREDEGHGSNDYWDQVKRFYQTCSFPQPGFDYGGGFYPTEALDNADDVSNYCTDENFQSSPSPNYGKAWDVGAAAGTVVCAPQLESVAYWISGTATSVGNGARVELQGFDSSDTLIYKMKLLHLEPTTIVAKNKRLELGDGVATVWNWDANSHVHVELKNLQTGETLQPEDYICL